MAATSNRLVASFEQWVADVPKRGELEEAPKRFEALNLALQAARAQGLAMEKRLATKIP